jgi:spermidine synthase
VKRRKTRPSRGSLTAAPPGALIVGTAFLLSGFTSLVLQVVWSKSLALLLGSTLHAMSTVVAVFLGGLALGAYLAGRLARRVTRPLSLYGWMEVGVGAYAFASLPILRALDPPITAAYSQLGPESPIYLAVRIALAALLLLPPTVLMGATLPFLVSWATRAGTPFGRSLGRLYGLNTLGAVLGSATAGFALIPSLGLSATTRVVGGVALLLGALLVWIGRRREHERPIETDANSGHGAAGEATAGGIESGKRRALAAIVFGLSGAVALVLEISWARIFALIYGSSVYSFALVLASYLLGLALGSILWGARLADSPRPWRTFALLQGAVAAGVVVGLWILPVMPRVFLGIIYGTRDNLPVLYLSQVGLAGLITFLPCLALGALFPVGARLVAAANASGASATGFAYAVNTAGTLTGSLLAGFVLLPVIGVHATLAACVALSLALAVVAWRAQGRAAAPPPVRSTAGPPAGKDKHPAPTSALSGATPALAGLVAIGVGALLAPEWNQALFTAGVYRTSAATSHGAKTGAEALALLDEWLSMEKILYYREGLHAIVSVHTLRDHPEILSMRANGKPEASTGIDIVTQLMCGSLPMRFAKPHPDVCLIGQGSGVTTKGALIHDPRSMLVVEIEEAVLEGSKFFDAVTETALADPRIQVVIEDGRQHLLRSGRTYDVIISEPSNPWIAGINNLFTVDFYRRVRGALRPGGVFCQWVQLYELSPEAQASLLRSIAEVFPDAEAFLMANTSDMLVIAAPLGTRVPAERLLIANSREKWATYLGRFGWQLDGAPAAFHVGRISRLVEKVPQAPLNTDDRPYVEYRAPKDLYRMPGSVDPWFLAEPRPLAGLRRWVPEAVLPQVALAAGSELVSLGVTERAEAMVVDLAAAGPEFAAAAAALKEICRHTEVAALAKLWIERGREALDHNDVAAAESSVARALAIDPESGPSHLLAGRLAMRAERLGEARANLERALRTTTGLDRCVAYNNLGIISMRESQMATGRAYFEAARGVHPSEPNTYLHLARWFRESARADSAEVVLREGLAVARPVEPIQRALAAVRTGQSF